MKPPTASSWHVLAEPTRRWLIDLLLVEGEATATTLAQDASVTRQAVLKHLTVLEQHGLVRRRQSGREVRFSVAEDKLREAATQMGGVASAWQDRLQRLKILAERLHADRQP